jgi:hypothetical protein
MSRIPLIKPAQKIAGNARGFRDGNLSAGVIIEGGLGSSEAHTVAADFSPSTSKSFVD